MTTVLQYYSTTVQHYLSFQSRHVSVHIISYSCCEAVNLQLRNNKKTFT